MAQFRAIFPGKSLANTGTKQATSQVREIVHSPSAQRRIAERTDGTGPARHAAVRSHGMFSYTRLRLNGMRAPVALVVVHVTSKRARESSAVRAAARRRRWQWALCNGCVCEERTSRAGTAGRLMPVSDGPRPTRAAQAPPLPASCSAERSESTEL